MLNNFTQQDIPAKRVNLMMNSIYASAVQPPRSLDVTRLQTLEGFPVLEVHDRALAKVMIKADRMTDFMGKGV